jgi:phenylacetic acid degradation operon negative regulatory protein
VSEAGSQSRAVIVTIYGLYARQAGGWLSVSTLVRLMAELGVEGPAARSLISRLKQRGIVQAVRKDGAAGYALSDSVWPILDQGDRRIFGRPRATLADGWLVAVFSVPESVRHRRHTLRSRLSWLGFGTVADGVWIAPEQLYDETRHVLDHYGLAGYVQLFRGGRLADEGDRIGQWWDLPALQRMYRDFLDAYRPVLARSRRRQPDDGTAFADYVRTITAWRRLPYLDPGLPIEVLPARWPGLAAEALLADLRERLELPAGRHVAAVIGAG